MNIQIFARKKCFDTQKAERYFKERRIKFQKIDLLSKGLSPGELKSIIQVLGMKNIIDHQSTTYFELNLDRITTPNLIENIILDHPQILVTPIVRNGKQATVGYKPEIWETWK